MLTVRLFGAIRLDDDGTPVAAGMGPAALLVLAYLLLHRAAPLARSSVASTLWPDVAESEGLARLRRYLFRLNAALPRQAREPWTVGDKHTVRWNPKAGVRVDVDEFDRLTMGETPVADALALCDGDILADYDGDWIVPIRKQRRDRCDEMLMELAARSRAACDLRSAVAYAERLRQRDPWREDVVRFLMDVLVGRGDRAGALRLFRRFAESLESEIGVAPESETIALEASIRRSHESLPLRRGNLPAPTTTLFGRALDLDELDTTFPADTCRVLTLTGSGGVGKSRLALELGRKASDRTSADVWLVELALLTAERFVPLAIASTLKIAEEPGRPLVNVLAAALKSSDSVLILDNCEHVLDTVAEVIETLVGACPALRIIATSREPLRIAGERRFIVGPLAVPAHGTHDGSGDASPSVAMFLARAAEHGRRIDVARPDQRRAVNAIVRRLDGIPLAIELAASRLSALALSDLAALVSDRLDILANGTRRTLPHHRTMKALIDWSTSSLSDDEARLLEYAAVFSGGATLEALTFIAARRLSGTQDAVSLLTSLVEKSLLTLDGASSSRYRMLESIRYYSLERLTERETLDDARLVHAAAVCAQAENSVDSLETMPENEWFALTVPDIHNLRSALDYCLTDGAGPELGARIAAAALPVFRHVSAAEGARWLEASVRLLPASASPRVVADVHSALGTYAAVLRTEPDWVTANLRAVAIYRELGDKPRLAQTLVHLGLSYGGSERLDEWLAAAAESVAISREIENPRLLQQALRIYANPLGALGDFDAMKTVLAESLRVWPDTDQEQARAKNHRVEAYAYGVHGMFREARAARTEALRLLERTPDLYRVVRVSELTSIAIASFALDDSGGAVEAARSALAIAESEEVKTRFYALDAATYAFASLGEFDSASLLHGFVHAQPSPMILSRPAFELLCERFRNHLGHRMAELLGRGSLLDFASAERLARTLVQR